jgi:hypothetical protein
MNEDRPSRVLVPRGELREDSSTAASDQPVSDNPGRIGGSKDVDTFPSDSLGRKRTYSAGTTLVLAGTARLIVEWDRWLRSRHLQTT